MAQKVQILLVDDLTGEEAHETITFGLDGALYEIDLSEKNAARMRSMCAKYATKARKVKGRAKRPAVRSADARKWAQENGVEVSDRGRVPASVVAQFEAANV